MNVRKLEECLAKIVKHLRAEAEAGDAALDRRLAAIETRMMGGDTVAERVLRGEPVGEREWLGFVGRLHRDPGVFDPARHSTWRGGR